MRVLVLIASLLLSSTPAAATPAEVDSLPLALRSSALSWNGLLAHGVSGGSGPNPLDEACEIAPSACERVLPVLRSVADPGQQVAFGEVCSVNDIAGCKAVRHVFNALCSSGAGRSLAGDCRRARGNLTPEPGAALLFALGALWVRRRARAG